eukprot:GILK01009670.1.p1 GENE.GILK01009670.1~~GILK01009670.1.p1  ORF type:complete len:255 (-),score=-6.99 GILK01009670.1:202-888(-)
MAVHHSDNQRTHFNFGHITAVLLFIIIVLAAVGTAGPQFSDKEVNGAGITCNDQIFLYQSRTKCDGQDGVRNKFDRDGFACKATYDRLTAAYAFALLACIIGFLALVMTLLTSFVPRVPSAIAVALVVFTFVCLTICWPISEGVRSNKQCDDGASYKDAGYGIAWGLACLITAWCLSVITAILAVIFGCLRPVVVVKKETETHTVHEPVAVAVPAGRTQPVVATQPAV